MLDASQRLVSIAAGTILDVGPAEAVEVAHAAGWPACGIWFDGETWTDRTTAAVRERLDATGVVALDVEPVILGGPRDDGDALVDAAISLGAQFVLVASRAASSPEVIDRFGQLCDRAQAGDVTVVMEFLPIFGVATLADALGVVTSADRPNGGVLVDTLHLSRSGGSASLLPEHRGLLPYLQLADAPEQPPDRTLPGLVDEALHGRQLLGEGALDIAGVLAAVPDVALSFELRSRDLMARHPDPTDRARALLRNWQAYSS